MKNSKYIFKYLFILLLSISSCLASMCSVFSMQEKSKGTSKKSPSHAQNAQSVSVNNSKKHKRDETNDETNNKANDEENNQKDDCQPPRKKRKITASDAIASDDKENSEKTETTTSKKRKRQPDLDDNHTTTTSTTSTTATTSQLPKRQKKLLPNKEYIITVSIDDKPPQTINLASVDISTPQGRKKMTQYLSWSVSKKNIKNVKTILEFFQEELISNPLNKDIIDEISLNVLVSIGPIKALEFLVALDRPIDVPNKTAFAFLLRAACLYGYVEGIQYLVDKCNASVNTPDEFGDTPLHHAARKGHAKVVQWLVQEGNARVEATDENGETPLHLAACEKHLKVVKFLVACGADLYAKNEQNKTPYQLILRESGDEIATQLAKEYEFVRAMTAHSIGEAFIRRLVLPKMYPKKEWLEQEEAQPAKQNDLNLLCKSIQDKSIEDNPAKCKDKAGHLLNCQYDTNLVGLVYELLYPKPAQSNQKSDCKKT